MIQVDKRAGSEKLISPLRSLGVEVEETILSYGDYS
jgi:ERCC4-type nuclease